MNKRSKLTVFLCLFLCVMMAAGCLPVQSTKADETAEVWYGDVNDDGKIDAKDVTMLRRHLAGGWNVTINEEKSDVNRDGEINAKDVTMLRRFLAGGWGVVMPEKNIAPEKVLSKPKITRTEVSYVDNDHGVEHGYGQDLDEGICIDMYGDDGLLYNRLRLYYYYDDMYKTVNESWSYRYEDGVRIEGNGIVKTNINDDGVEKIAARYEYTDNEISESLEWDVVTKNRWGYSKMIPLITSSIKYDKDWIIKESTNYAYSDPQPDGSYDAKSSIINNYEYYYNSKGQLVHRSERGSSGSSSSSHSLGGGHWQDMFYEYNVDGTLKSQGELNSDFQPAQIESVEDCYLYYPQVTFSYETDNKLIGITKFKNIYHHYYDDEYGIYYDSVESVEQIPEWTVAIEYCPDGKVDQVTWNEIKTGRKAIFSINYGENNSLEDVVSVEEFIPIDENVFPDNIFRNMVSNEFDKNKDGKLDNKELEAVTVIYCNGMDIADLTGIQSFTALATLNCNWNQLTSLDVSHNTALTELYCCDNQLTSLDLSSNKALTELNCEWNQIASLDVHNNLMLKEIYCGHNQLTSLDVNENEYLVKLFCEWNQLVSLDVSKNTALTKLKCQDNPLTNLIVSDKMVLSDDGVYIIGDIAIDEDSFPDEVFRNYVKQFDNDNDDILSRSERDVVTLIDVRNLGIEDLTGIELFENMTELDCSGNWLSDLDVSKNYDLRSLDCSGNWLSDLDVSKNYDLRSLDCSGNWLSDLDVSKNGVLMNLDCSRNQLTSLDVSNNIVLTELACYENQLTSLDTSNNSNLTDISCEENQLTSLDVRTNSNLMRLWCYHNQLTSLDVSSNSNLVYLSCGENQLASLDVSNNSNLSDFHLFCDEAVVVIR